MEMQTKIPIRNGDETIIGNDGLLYCKKCGKAKEMYIDFPTFDGTHRKERHKVRKMCDCEIKNHEQEQKRMEFNERQIKIDRLRGISLMDSKLYNARFSTFKITDQNDRIYRIAKNYVNKWDVVSKSHQGLLFYGDVGTGKSYTAAVIANELMERLHPVIMTSFIKLLSEAGKRKLNDDDDHIERLNDASLLVIDDLGAERSTDYALEIVYNVIDSRYRSGKPIILTTNLSLNEMKAEKDISYSRIYDRIFEMCYPVHFTGLSWRKKEASERFGNMKKMLEG